MVEVKALHIYCACSSINGYDGVTQRLAGVAPGRLSIGKSGTVIRLHADVRSFCREVKILGDWVLHHRFAAKVDIGGLNLLTDGLEDFVQRVTVVCC